MRQGRRENGFREEKWRKEGSGRRQGRKQGKRGERTGASSAGVSGGDSLMVAPVLLKLRCCFILFTCWRESI